MTKPGAFTGGRAEGVGAYAFGGIKMETIDTAFARHVQSGEGHHRMADDLAEAIGFRAKCYTYPPAIAHDLAMFYICHEASRANRRGFDQ